MAACALSPAADCVAAGSEDGQLYLWSFADGLMSQSLRPTSSAAVNAIAVVDSAGTRARPSANVPAADHLMWQLAVGCEDGSLHVVDCSSG